MNYSVYLVRKSDGKKFGTAEAPHKFNSSAERQVWINKLVNKKVLGHNGPEDFDIFTEDTHEQEIDALYKVLVQEIYDEMETVFGTRNDASAIAFANTWEAMEKRPGNFVHADLGFSNAQEVKAYADAKLTEADAYGLFRLRKITKFEADKAAILNG